MVHIDDNMPTFAGLLAGIRIAFTEFGLDWEKYPTDYPLLWEKLTDFGSNNAALVLAIASSLTVLRLVLTRLVYQPLRQWLDVDTKNAKKFVESMWKLMIHSLLWYYSLHLVIISGRYDFFENSCDIWKEVNRDFFYKPVPTDIHIMYMWQIGYYLQNTFTFFVMDTWRKDASMMLIHHFVTIGLLYTSFCMRFYKIGALVLFLHDISDVALELTKLSIYLKKRNGQRYRVFEIAVLIATVLFGSSWFVCRLYWFPLKVLHSANWCSYKYHRNKSPWMYLPSTLMLLILQVLHIIWTSFIVNFAWKITTTNISEIRDPREEESENGNRRPTAVKGHSD